MKPRGEKKAECYVKKKGLYFKLPKRKKFK